MIQRGVKESYPGACVCVSFSGTLLGHIFREHFSGTFFGHIFRAQFRWFRSRNQLFLGAQFREARPKQPPNPPPQQPPETSAQTAPKNPPKNFVVELPCLFFRAHFSGTRSVRRHSLFLLPFGDHFRLHFRRHYSGTFFGHIFGAHFWGTFFGHIFRVHFSGTFFGHNSWASI